MNCIYPNCIETEKVVLGAILSSSHALNEVRELLAPDCFYDPFHRNVFEAIHAIDMRGEEADVLSVSREMKKRNVQFDLYQLSVLMNGYASDVYSPAAYLTDLARRRKCLEMSERIRRSALDESVDVMDAVSELADGLHQLFEGPSEHVSLLDDAVKGVVKRMEDNSSGKADMSGTPTGFPSLDKLSGGLQTSDLIVVAADTSQGKTSLAIAMTLSAVRSGAGAAIYSMEMKKEQIAARMMAIESGVPANEILYSKLSPQAFDRIDRGLSRLYGLPVYFDDRSTSNIDMILTSIRSLRIKYGIEGAVIDYIQILNINMKGSNKEVQMADVSRRLKNLAKELDIWIIALSQFNRDHQDPVPRVNRLRDSGQIGEAADTIILLYRPEMYKRNYPEPFSRVDPSGTAMIDVAKGRNTGLTKFIVKFDAPTTFFYEADEIPLLERSGCKEEDIPLW